MKANTLLCVFVLLLLSCSTVKLTDRNSVNFFDTIIYSYKVMPSNSIVQYQLDSKFWNDNNYFSFNIMTDSAPKEGTYLLSRIPYFWRNDTLFRAYDFRLPEVPIFSKELGNDTITSMGKYYSMLSVSNYLGNRKLLKYRIDGYPINPSKYATISYLEGVGFTEINIIHDISNPSANYLWKLVELNDVDLDKFLMRLDTKSIIIE